MDLCAVVSQPLVDTMGRKRKKLEEMDRSEQEVLAEEVRKYPSLYDPSHPCFRDLKQKDRAWKLVTVALGYEEGEAFKQFDLLRSRYREKQSEWMKKTTSDSLKTNTEGEETDDDEKQFKFLTWLQPYINIPVNNDVIELFPSPSQIDDDDTVDVRSEDSDSADSADSDHDSNHEDEIRYYLPVPEKTVPVGPHNANITTSPEQTSNRKRRYSWKTTENRHNKRKEIAEFQSSSDFVPNTFNALNHPFMNATNQDDIFGHMIAGELKSLPQHAKVQVKYDIQNILYRHQMVQLQHMQKFNMQGGQHPGFGILQPNRGVATFSKDSSVALQHSKGALETSSDDVTETKTVKQEPT